MNQIDLFCRMHHVEHKLSGEYGWPRSDWPVIYIDSLLPVWNSYGSPHGTHGAPEDGILGSLSTTLLVAADTHRCLFMLEFLTSHVPDTLTNFSASVLVDNHSVLLRQHLRDMPEYDHRPDWEVRRPVLQSVDFVDYDQR